MEADKKRVTLTRKKTMLTSTLPVVGSYRAARPGLVAHGFVVSIKSFGCIVRFYNEVKGLVPLRELSTEPLASPEEVFYVGQVRGVGRAASRVDWAGFDSLSQSVLQEC